MSIAGKRKGVVRSIIADGVVLCLFGVWLWSLPVKIGLDMVMFREEIRNGNKASR